MQLTLIRHLPTEWNRKQKLQGRNDIGISAVSKELLAEIEENKEKLKKLEPFDIVLASTLKRTRQTARLYGFFPETDGLLDELDFGPFEGRSKEDLLAVYGDAWVKTPRQLVLGESLLHLENRIVSFLKKYKDCSSLLVFGHGSWIRAVISYHQYGDINKMNQITVKNNQCIALRF
jgi:broad specificity phosphatase PhoE